jgi:hypothetical protein
VLRGLHLKTGLTSLGGNLLVVDSSSIDVTALDGFRFIETGEADNYAANCLAMGETVLMPAGFPKVAKNIRKEGLRTVELEMSEFEKAEGGLTCLSIIFNLNVEKKNTNPSSQPISPEMENLYRISPLPRKFQVKPRRAYQNSSSGCLNPPRNTLQRRD